MFFYTSPYDGVYPMSESQVKKKRGLRKLLAIKKSDMHIKNSLKIR